MSKSFKLFCSQVSGKQPKLLSEDETIVLKGYAQCQNEFYQFIQSITISSSAYCLRQFLPKYQGVLSIDEIPIIHHNQKIKDQKTLQWLQHLKKRYETRNPQNKFIMLENIIHSYKKPNVLDIKLGSKGHKKLKPKKQNFKDLFILNGCRINVKHFQNQNSNDFQILFFSKYFFKTLTTHEDIFEHLSLYFFDGEILRINLLHRIIEKLRQLILALKCLKGWKFYSTSLCLFYDAQNDEKFDVKLLDFGRSIYTGLDEVEQATINGLQNLNRFLIQIKNKHLIIQKRLSHMKEKYLKQAIVIVPQRKVIEYEGSSRQVSTTSSPIKNMTQ